MRYRRPPIVIPPGTRFGRLVVLCPLGTIKSQSGEMQSRFLCRCDCGNEVTPRGSLLRSGKTLSCGCVRRRRFLSMVTKHGHAKGHRSRTYRAWVDMHDRCARPNHVSYPYYGGRGIRVCDRWASFESFLADMGETPAGQTLDRRDPSGHYHKDNCRWATMQSQQNNRRSNVRVTYKGVTMTAAELARVAGLPQKLVQERLRNGCSPELAIRPVRK